MLLSGIERVERIHSQVCVQSTSFVPLTARQISSPIVCVRLLGIVVCLTYAKFLLNFLGPVAGLYSRIVAVDYGTYYLFASQARPAFKEILVTLSAITN